jgi:hypothetical protein
MRGSSIRTLQAFLLVNVVFTLSGAAAPRAEQHTLREEADAPALRAEQSVHAPIRPATPVWPARFSVRALLDLCVVLTMPSLRCNEAAVQERTQLRLPRCIF